MKQALRLLPDVFAALWLGLALGGCAHQPLEQRERPEAYEALRQKVVQESARFATQQDRLRRDLEKHGPPARALKPLLPAYNPLDDVLVSLSMDNEDVRNVLRALAQETGMNLSIDPALAREPRTISLHFAQVPASKVFREILRIANINGEVDGNVLRVTPYQEKLFQLDFIETNVQASFDVGGDVLGSGNGSSTTTSSSAGGGSARLSGNFKLSGTGATVSNPYESLETTLRAMLSPEGTLSLNRMAGTLYVRDRPSVVRSVERVLNRYRDTLSRQVLLEARILEVRLSDSYRWGVDWAYLRNMLDGTVGISKAITQTIGTDGGITRTSTPGPTDPELGFVLSRAAGSSTTLLAVSLLENFGDVQVLSNPTIRVRHGQPAMISVGRSNTYIRESTTTTSAGVTVGGSTLATSIETDTVFDGLLLGVIPFIGDDGRISLSIHPIKSDVDADSLKLVQIQDTAVSLPKVNLKEMSTTIEMNDGDTVVLGGLIDKVRTQDKGGLPGLSQVPGLGRLFTDESANEDVRELVIVLKATEL